MTPTPPVVVLYRDDHFVAIHKPPGIHVHRSPFDREEPALAEAVEAQLGCRVYPAHRLDRPTSGVLLFALHSSAAAGLGAAFRERRVHKTYQAVVRGWLEATHAQTAVRLDRKLSETIDAETWLRPLERYEAPWPRRGFDTFRFALIEALPVTGRRHQIRQHCDQLRHPILGDTVWGDTGLNGWLAQHFELGGLHLFCRRLEFPHPVTGVVQTVEAPLWPDQAQRLAYYQSFRVETGSE